MIPVSNSDLDTESEVAGAPDGELGLGQGSELTAEHRETIAPELVGQKLTEEPPKPSGHIVSDSGSAKTPSAELEERDASHFTSPVWQCQEHTRK